MYIQRVHRDLTYTYTYTVCQNRYNKYQAHCGFVLQKKFMLRQDDFVRDKSPPPGGRGWDESGAGGIQLVTRREVLSFADDAWTVALIKVTAVFNHFNIAANAQQYRILRFSVSMETYACRCARRHKKNRTKYFIKGEKRLRCRLHKRSLFHATFVWSVHNTVQLSSKYNDPACYIQILISMI